MLASFPYGQAFKIMVIAHLQRFFIQSNLKEQFSTTQKNLVHVLTLKNDTGSTSGQGYTKTCGHPRLSDDFVPFVANVLK